jgi:hypothetical protein
MPSYHQKIKKVLPDGEYPAVVINAANKYTQKGDEKIALTLRVGHGKDTIEISTDLIFVDDWYGFPRITQFESATGGTVEDGASADLDAADCVGRTCLIVLKTGEWQGTARNEVVCFLPLPSDATPPEVDEIPMNDETIMERPF